MSLRLYCSRREGSPSQPWKRSNEISTCEILCSPSCHELSWEVGRHLKEGLHTVLVPAINCHLCVFVHCPMTHFTHFFSLLNGTSLKVLSVGLHSKSHQQILSVRIDIHFLGGAGYILWIRCVWKIWAAADGQRRINNYQVYQVWEVLLNLLRWQPSHQVEGTVKLLLSHSAPGWSPLQGGLNNFKTNSNYKSCKLVGNNIARVWMDYIIELFRC